MPAGASFGCRWRSRALERDRRDDERVTGTDRCDEDALIDARDLGSIQLPDGRVGRHDERALAGSAVVGDEERLAAEIPSAAEIGRDGSRGALGEPDLATDDEARDPDLDRLAVVQAPRRYDRDGRMIDGERLNLLRPGHTVGYVFHVRP